MGRAAWAPAGDQFHMEKTSTGRLGRIYYRAVHTEAGWVPQVSQSRTLIGLHRWRPISSPKQTQGDALATAATLARSLVMEASGSDLSLSGGKG